MKGKKTGGRQTGTPNKISADIKAAIEGALEAVGGQQYLEAVALDHPQVFCSLLSRLIPKKEDLSMQVVVEEPEDTYDLARRIAFILAKGAKDPRAGGKGLRPRKSSERDVSKLRSDRTDRD